MSGIWSLNVPWLAFICQLALPHLNNCIIEDKTHICLLLKPTEKTKRNSLLEDIKPKDFKKLRKQNTKINLQEFDSFWNMERSQNQNTVSGNRLQPNTFDISMLDPPKRIKKTKINQKLIK